jgi:hypothetical protein
MKVVVTGVLATYPLGGVAWDYLAYVKGFRGLGAEVLYLEDTGHWVYDPRRGTFTDAVEFNLHYLQNVLAAAGADMRDHWSFRALDGAHYGLAEAAVSRFCRQADLFLNVSGCCWFREAYRGARVAAYVDTDPGYSHAKLAAVAQGTASAEDAYSVDLIRSHDRFFTAAEAVGHPSCVLPDGGLEWQTTRQPIVLEDWPVAYRPDADTFTTVMSWKTDETPPTIGGVTYGGKDVEFVRFIDLPRHTATPLEIAVAGNAPRERLRQHGWRVVDAAERSATMDAYRDYLRSARGEWSVAKQAYVATGSGWFSCRSACYLALGKPVVVQDTGFSRVHPTGAGLFAFTTMDEAAAAFDEIARNYRRHSEAARALAERDFDSRRVLERLCRDAGL